MSESNQESLHRELHAWIVLRSALPMVQQHLQGWKHRYGRGLVYVEERGVGRQCTCTYVPARDIPQFWGDGPEELPLSVARYDHSSEAVVAITTGSGTVVMELGIGTISRWSMRVQ